MNKSERIAFFLLAFLVWVYLGLRSLYIPLIHDETVTYFVYIQNGNFLPPWAYWDANNHILNSGLGAFFNAIFGHSPFVARLGSWLSFVPFVFFVKGISEFIEDKMSRWAALITLFTTPFFIEFFSLTRGYGMAMSWFLGTLFFAMQYVKTRNFIFIYWMGLTGLLASLSSLSLIIAVFIVFGWVLLYRFFMEKEVNLFNEIKTTLILYVPQLPLVYLGFLLKEKGLLYYGGDNVIQFSLQPFARYFLNNRELWWVFAGVIILLVLVYLVSFIKNGKREIFNPIRIFPFVLLLSVFAVFSQHFLLEVNYPEDRAALYFFPLIIFSWVTIPKLRKLKLVLLVPLIWFPLDLVTSANIQYSKLWPNEHVPLRFWEETHALKKTYPASLSAYFLRNGIWNYHSLDREYSSSPNSAEYPSEWADVLLVDSVRIKKVDLSKYIELGYDEISGQTLLKREPELIETQILDTVFGSPIQNLYTNIWEFSGEKLSGIPVALYYDFELKSNTKLAHLHIITSVFDTMGSEVYTIKYDLSLVSEHWDQQKKWRVKQFLPPLPNNTGRFVSYIYNPFEEQYEWIEMKSTIVRLSEPEIGN